MSEERRASREEITQAFQKALKPYIGQRVDTNLKDKVRDVLVKEMTLLLGDVPLPPFQVVQSGPDRINIVFGEEAECLKKESSA